MKLELYLTILGNDEVFLGRNLGKGRDFSEEIGSKIDTEIKRFIDDAYDKAKKLLQQNVNKLHAVAQALIEKEKLDAQEFEDIFVNN